VNDPTVRRSTARPRLRSGKVVLVMKIVARINAYFPDRNYGFLHQNNDGVVVKHFLHLNNVVSGVPKTGLMARFDSVIGEKGSIAVNVEILGVAE
jgi:cold shock CspA family protein